MGMIRDVAQILQAFETNPEGYNFKDYWGEVDAQFPAAGTKTT